MTEKNKNILLGVLIVGIISMTIAYAALSSNLNINGSATVQNKYTNWNIHFAHIENTLNEVKTSGYATTTGTLDLSNDDTIVTVPSVTLKAPGDKVEYIFKVVNEGTIPGYINVLNNIGIGTITYGSGETLTLSQKESFQNDIQVTLTYNDALKTALSYNDELDEGNERELILTIQYLYRDIEQVLPTKDVTFSNIRASITYGQDRTSLSGSGSAPSLPQVIQKVTYDISLNKGTSTNTPTSSVEVEINSDKIIPNSITLPERNYIVTISTSYTTTRKSTGVSITNGGDKTSSYIFDGWYTDETGGSLVLSSDLSPILQSNVSGYTDENGNWIKDSNTTLYARFSGTGGVTLPQITKTGYKCGWTPNENGITVQHESGETLSNVIADVTLYAVCELGVYTVSLDNQSATSAGTTTIYEKYSTGYYLDIDATTQMSTSSNGITIPTKTSYVFGGYYTGTNGSGTQYIDENGKITSNVSSTINTNNNGKLYAYWKPKLTLKKGDYVKMIPSTSTFTTNTTYTGYKETQTIKPSELTIWRVIRVNSDGTYDAVSDRLSSTNINFGRPGENNTIYPSSSINAYSYYIHYLNFLAGKYENPKYTVGSRYIGFNGQTRIINDTTYFSTTYIRNCTTGKEWTTGTSGTPAEEYLGRGDSLYTTDLSLVSSVYGTYYAKVVGSTGSANYFIASRVYGRSSNCQISFGLRYIANQNNGLFTSQSLFGIASNGNFYNTYTLSARLRPIITLKSNISASSGTGASESSPYVLY